MHEGGGALLRRQAAHLSRGLARRRLDVPPPTGRYVLRLLDRGHREVFGLRHGPVAFGPGTPKPWGVYLPAVREAFPEDAEATILGTCTDLDSLRAVVEDAEGPKTLEWLRERLVSG